MVHLSSLLALQDTSAPIVQEIKKEEARERAKLAAAVTCPYCHATVDCELVADHRAASYVHCAACERHFRVRRRGGIVTTHRLSADPPRSSNEAHDALQADRLRALAIARALDEGTPPKPAVGDTLVRRLLSLFSDESEADDQTSVERACVRCGRTYSTTPLRHRAFGGACCGFRPS